MIAHTAGTPVSTTAKPPRCRRFIPLSLRMFFGLLMLVGLGSAIVLLWPVYRQGVAIREIERVKGDFLAEPVGSKWLRTRVGAERMKCFDKVVGVSLRGTTANDDTLRALTGLPDVKELMIDSPHVTDAGLAHLRELTRLEILSIGERTPLTGLAFAKGMNGLKYLDLTDAPITDEDLADLKDLKNLKRLHLDYTRVTDSGLAHLQGMPKLDHVTVRETLVTPNGLAALHRSLPARHRSIHGN